MNKRDLKKFQNLLLRERERIINGVERLHKDTLYQPASDNSSSDLTNYAEVGTDNFEREVALRLASNEADLLYEIDEALKRIDNGTYGVCEGSGEQIPRKRLEVFPAARYTIEYQEKLEKEGRL